MKQKQPRPQTVTVTVTAKDSGGNEKSAQTALGGASLSAIRFATTGTVPADRLIGISDITIIQ